MSKLIYSKEIQQNLKTELKNKVAHFKSLGQREPCLTVILVGDDPASKIYVNKKHNLCNEVGIKSNIINLPANITEQDLINTVNKLNNDTNIDGILVQFPLPKHIDVIKIAKTIHPYKDVDGLHPQNIGLLCQSRPYLRPCTPQGVMLILNSINPIIRGKHAVVVGSSNIVGRPMALELLMAGATVTIANSSTKNLPEVVKQGDILIVAIGKPHFIQKDWIKPNAIIIDVGINYQDGKILGDVDPLALDNAQALTAVPGGVGPMTVAMLIKNTIDAYEYKLI